MPNVNDNLHRAKKAKNDEFYTQFQDIEKEVMSYPREHWQDAVVLLPCDDPETSNFTKFFVLKFQEFGLKRLVSTSYDVNGGRGRIAVIERGENVDPNNIPWRHLEGDGDFRSAEVTALRDAADIVVTNPPFSLFREFVAWLDEG